MFLCSQTNRCWNRLAVATILCMAILAACGGESAAEKGPGSVASTAPDAPLPPIRLALQWKPQSQFAGYYLARDKGLYRAAGLDVRLVHGSSDHPSLEMLLDGSVELATLFLTDAMIAAAAPRHAGIVQLAQWVQRSNLMLLAWKDLGIASAKDLDGQRISFWQGSFSSSFQAFFAANGINPVPIPQYYSVSLFLKRGVAACAAMEYNEYHRIWQSGIDGERITAFRMRDFGLGFPEDGLYATAHWVDLNPAPARAVHKATLAGWHYARAHPEEAIDAVMAEARRAGVPANRPQERWMLRTILDSIFVPGDAPEAVGTLDQGVFTKAARAMGAAGLLERPPAFAAFAPFARIAP